MGHKKAELKKSSSPKWDFNKLNDDILFNLNSYLKIQDKLSLLQVNQSFRNAINRDINFSSERALLLDGLIKQIQIKIGRKEYKMQKIQPNDQLNHLPVAIPIGSSYMPPGAEVYNLGRIPLNFFNNRSIKRLNQKLEDLQNIQKIIAP
ncbi:MAG: hypothetical protein H0U57_10295 [Tatlockia sp.]|nr:hypothetical protein [Tatlockia sp.]